MCISDVREEGGLATLEELKEKFGAEKVVFKNSLNQRRLLLKLRRIESKLVMQVTFVQCDVTKPEQFSKYDHIAHFLFHLHVIYPLIIFRLFDECEAYFKVCF